MHLSTYLRIASDGPPGPARARASAQSSGRRYSPFPARLGPARLSVFCDSSALVKLYADEPGADAVRLLSNLVVSSIARVEVPAAFWRKHRLGELSLEDTSVLAAAFEWDWFGGDGELPAFAAVRLADTVLESAARSLARHPLRAADAVQLAPALAARAADPSLTEFSCFDEELAGAARSEGFRVVP